MRATLGIMLNKLEGLQAGSFSSTLGKNEVSLVNIRRNRNAPYPYSFGSHIGYLLKYCLHKVEEIQ